MKDEETSARITLRLSKEVYEKIQDAAHKSARSANAEIAARLDRSFLPHARGEENPANRVIASLAKQVETLEKQITLLQYVLGRAGGMIKHALIQGRDRRIPESEAKWLADEANSLSKLTVQTTTVSDDLDALYDADDHNVGFRSR